MRVLYGMDRYVTQHLRLHNHQAEGSVTPLVYRRVRIGDVITKTRRRVAFQKSYQHHVQPFRSEDPTKPSNRKIFVFFSVDPTQKVLSATDVAPHQRELVTEVIGCPTPVKFPHLRNFPLSCSRSSEAEEYWKVLVSERAIIAEENDRTYFGGVRPRR